MKTITLKRIEIEPRALKTGCLSQKARLLMKFDPLPQFLRVVVMKALGVILPGISGFHDFCGLGYHSRGYK